MPAIVGYVQESVTKDHRDRVKKLWADLDAGRDGRTHREKRWKRSENQYLGDMWERDDPSSDLIHVGVSFSTANTILPHITGRDPVFMVEPISKEATPKNARLQEAFLNRKWKQIDGQSALESAAFDYVVYGDGFLKTTYELVDQAISADQTSTTVQEYLDRISPWDVWIDPIADGIHNARWLAVRTWLTKEEVEANKSLNVPRSFEYTAKTPSDESDAGRFKGSGSEHRDWVELYELYDLVNDWLFIVPKDSDRPWKVVDGITAPIEQIGNHRIPNSPYHMGDLEPIYDVQREIDKTRSQQITHRKRNIAKLLVREDAITPEGLAAMTSGVVGEMVPIKNKDMPLSDVAKEIQLAPLSADSYQVSEQAASDVYEISGITEYQRGASPDITRTATEAQIMQGSSNVKLDAKLKTIERAISKIGEYLLAIAREVYPETDVDEMAMFIGGTDARAINQMQAGDEAKAALEQGDMQGAEAIAATAGLYGETILTPSDEMFLGTYQVYVEHASTDATNPAKKAEKYRRTFQQLVEVKPLLDQAGIPLDLGRMLRLWLEAEGIPGVDAILTGGQAPPQPVGPQGPGAPSASAPASQQGLPPGPMGIPDGLDPAMIEQLLAAAGSAPGGPMAPIGPENSGALDPGAYPNVGR